MRGFQNRNLEQQGIKHYYQWYKEFNQSLVLSPRKFNHCFLTFFIWALMFFSFLSMLCLFFKVSFCFFLNYFHFPYSFLLSFIPILSIPFNLFQLLFHLISITPCLFTPVFLFFLSFYFLSNSIILSFIFCLIISFLTLYSLQNVYIHSLSHAERK